MGTPIYQVDAFTAQPFRGNPAAVCVLDRPAEEGWMRHVAAEMNLSETAFLSPRTEGWDLRWFTPKVEVSLCGHATLASAHVLWETGRLRPREIGRFHTRSGVLAARRRREWIQMDFPAQPATPAEPPAGLPAALGVEPIRTCHCGWTWLVEVADADAVRALRPDLPALAACPPGSAIVTAASDTGDYDFISRFFAPAIGIDEDPVTGAAHCCLGPYWAERLGKAELTGYQASARGGIVKVRVSADRALLSGQAVTILAGELTQSPLAP